MIIISRKIIAEFGAREPRSLDSLNTWFKQTKEANWKNFSEVRRSFNSVDSVGNDRYVFNIKGNDYRLIALIHFNIRTLYILFIGTHNDYNKVRAASIQYKK